MEKTLEELKAEADVLGVEYSPNIGAKKLSEKIEAYYESQAAGDSVKVQAEPEPVKEAKKTISKEETKEAKWRRIGAELKAKALQTRVVTITNNDPRESSVLTADYAGMENQFFSGKSLIIPFGIPTEVPQCVINVLKRTMITVHADEIINGQRTGNKVPKSVKKYNISYEDMK